MLGTGELVPDRDSWEDGNLWSLTQICQGINPMWMCQVAIAGHILWELLALQE